MSPYLPPLEGRDPNTYALLDFNERTIPINRSVKQALIDYIAQDRLQMYPSYGDIVPLLAAYAGVSSTQLMITNGSDQGIDIVFRAVAEPGLEAIIPGPSFAMYSQCAQIENLHIIEPQYSRKNGYPIAEVLASVSSKTVIIVVANPNNPCGTGIDSDALVQLSKSAPHAALLVDECYFEYSGVTLVPKLNELKNVFITRTFSKTWGLPSLRFGYLISSADNIRALSNIRGPYDINQLAIVAAKAALANINDNQAYVDEVMNMAKPQLEAWLEERDIEYWPSSANFLWVFPDKPEALNDYFIRHGILVRPKHYQGVMGLRITVGTQAQITRLTKTWEDYEATIGLRGFDKGN
jgi:histidinol-phosphate aminotransferase